MDRKGLNPAAMAGVVSFSKAVLFAVYVGLLFYISKSLKEKYDERQCISSKSCPSHHRTFKARSTPLPSSQPQQPGFSSSPLRSRTQQELTPAESPRNATQQADNNDDSTSELVSSTTTQTSSLVYATDVPESYFTSTSEQATSTSFRTRRGKSHTVPKRGSQGNRKHTNARSTSARIAVGSEDSSVTDHDVITQDSLDTLQDIEQDITELGVAPTVEPGAIHTKSCRKQARMSPGLKQHKPVKQESEVPEIQYLPCSKKVGTNPTFKSMKQREMGSPAINNAAAKEHLQEWTTSISPGSNPREMEAIATNKALADKEYLQKRSTSRSPASKHREAKTTAIAGKELLPEWSTSTSPASKHREMKTPAIADKELLQKWSTSTSPASNQRETKTTAIAGKELLLEWSTSTSPASKHRETKTTAIAGKELLQEWSTSTSLASKHRETKTTAVAGKELLRKWSTSTSPASNHRETKTTAIAGKELLQEWSTSTSPSSKQRETQTTVITSKELLHEWSSSTSSASEQSETKTTAIAGKELLQEWSTSTSLASKQRETKTTSINKAAGKELLQEWSPSTSPASEQRETKTTSINKADGKELLQEWSYSTSPASKQREMKTTSISKAAGKELLQEWSTSTNLATKQSEMKTTVINKAAGKECLNEWPTSTSPGLKRREMNASKAAGNERFHYWSTSNSPKLENKKESPMCSKELKEGQRYGQENYTTFLGRPLKSCESPSKDPLRQKQVQKKGSGELKPPKLGSKDCNYTGFFTTSGKSKGTRKSSSHSMVFPNQSRSPKNTSQESIFISKPPKAGKAEVVETIPGIPSPKTSRIQDGNRSKSDAISIPQRVTTETLTIRGSCVLEVEKSDDDIINNCGSNEELAENVSPNALIEDISPVRLSPLIQEMSELLDKDICQSDNLKIVRGEAENDLLFEDNKTSSDLSSHSDNFQQRAIIGEISSERSVAKTAGKALIEEISFEDWSTPDDFIRTQTSYYTDAGVSVVLLKELSLDGENSFITTGYNTNSALSANINDPVLQDVSIPSSSKQDNNEENSPLMESIGIQVCLPHEKVSEKVGVDEITVKIDSRPSSEGESSSYLAVPRDKAKSWSSLPSTSPAAEESARTDKSNQAEFYDEDGAGIAKDNTTRWKVMLKGGKRKKSLRVKFKDVRRSLASLSPPNLDCSSEGESTGSENSPRHSIYHTCSTKSMEKLESDESTGPWYS